MRPALSTSSLSRSSPSSSTYLAVSYLARTLPPDADGPLPTLPLNVAHFIAQALSAAVATIDLCWPTLKTCVWSDTEEGGLGGWLLESEYK
jgi:hypothetical protein